jgi:Tfp pilus assembly protein PilO
MVETSEFASELAVRIAVIGTAEDISGLNSEIGFLSLFFLTKNIMVARVKEKR